MGVPGGSGELETASILHCDYSFVNLLYQYVRGQCVPVWRVEHDHARAVDRVPAKYINRPRTGQGLHLELLPANSHTNGHKAISTFRSG